MKRTVVLRALTSLSLLAYTVPPAPDPAALVHGELVFTDAHGALWLMPASGHNRRKLTTSSGPNFDPSFSPDGQRILFRTSSGRYTPDTLGHGAEGIAVVNRTGTGTRQVFPFEAAQRGGLFAQWSPTDDVISVTAIAADGRSEELRLITPDRRLLRTIRAPHGVIEGARWSPDGQRLLFHSHGGSGDWQLWVMNADGSQQRQLTFDPPARPHGEGGSKGGLWAPDGKRILFQSDRDGTPDLYVIRADGGRPKRLTWGGGVEDPQAWLPSGWMVYASWATGSATPSWWACAEDATQLTALTQLQGLGTPIAWRP